MNKPEAKRDEQSLVKLYMELTGAAEANARSVLMYVQPAVEQTAEEVPPAATKDP